MEGFARDQTAAFGSPSLFARMASLHWLTPGDRDPPVPCRNCMKSIRGASDQGTTGNGQSLCFNAIRL
jgi:hypothetical protein